MCGLAAAGNVFGMQYIFFYRGAVLALSLGKAVTFDVAKSKPRVRQGKDQDGYSPRLKVLEENRKHAAIERILQRHPTLVSKYSVAMCKVPVLWFMLFHLYGKPPAVWGRADCCKCLMQ